MSSLADTIQRMQIQQLENTVTLSEHQIRKAKAEADLAELILKRAIESLPSTKLGGHLS